ncbi:MAG: DUF3800 domain-containing protein [Pseudolabrys sp.]|nr:DUF3800 domain-containing protein [Pseudolabrys sp.]
MAFIDPKHRYRLFFDETGNGDPKAHLKDQNQRYLSLTGIVFRQDVHDTTFSVRMAAFKRRHFGTTDVILHRRDIMGHKGRFSILEDEGRRRAFDEGFANLLEYLPGPAFTVSIDKQEHLDRYQIWRFDPYHYILTCLVERYVLWLHRNGYVGDVMGEARGPYHDGRLRRSFGRMHEKGSDFVRQNVVQARLISKELRLVEKHANVAGIQVADLLAHPAHRTYKFMKLGMPIPDDYGSSLVRAIEPIYDRHPRNGRIEGCGRKWLP